MFIQHNDRQTPAELAKEAIKGALFVLLFAVFPIVVLQVAKDKIEELEISQLINSNRQIHERILNKIKQADNNAAMIGRAINHVVTGSAGLDKNELRIRWFKQLSVSFPGAYDLFAFNEQGKLLPELSSSRHPRRAIEFAFEAMLAFSQNRPISSGKMGLLKNIVGLQEIPTMLKHRQTVTKLGNRKIDSHFCWNHGIASKTGDLSRPVSFLAMLHESNFTENHALKNSLKWVNHHYSGLQAGMVRISTDNSEIFPASLAALDDLRLSLLRSEGKYENFFRGNGYFCTFSKKTVDQFIFVAQPEPIFFNHATNLSLNLLCIAWCIFVFRNLPLKNRQIRGGITAKLVFLFLFAIGSPSFILMTGGYYALKDHSNVLQQELENGIVNKLNHFDEKYPLDLENLGSFLRAIVMKSQKKQSLEEIVEILQESRERKHLFMQGYLLDEKGTELFSVDKNRKSANKNERIVILVAKELLARLNKSMKVDSGTLMMEATEDFFSSVLDQNFDFNVLIKSMGEFIPMSFGSEGSYLFSEAIFDKDGTAKYAVIFVANRPVVARNFILRNIDSLAAQQEFNWKVNAYGINPLARDILTTPGEIDRIRNLVKTLVAKNSPVREVTASGSEEILWYAQRGAHLFDYALLASTSLKPLREEIERKWQYLILLAVTIFLVATLIGFTLSNQFLKPIEGLTAGVKAIDQRQFDVKVPIYSQDELGQLSSLMNNVLEGMKDLQVASIVQTSLFPSEKLCEKGIEIYGQSRAMTDIGGDYFDYYVTTGNKIIGLVGDVSGHGVSAALIMGMAKYAFTTQEAAARPLPETLAAFNLFLIANIKRKKMMTMFLYSIDTETFVMEYANAGHNFPFHYQHRDSVSVQLSMESFPLGIRAKSKYSSARITLEPGDKLLMYTDGLVEATGISGEIIGYETAKNWFSQCSDLNAEEAVTEMFAIFDRATDRRAAEDDISMIVINRLS